MKDIIKYTPQWELVMNGALVPLRGSLIEEPVLNDRIDLCELSSGILH